MQTRTKKALQRRDLDVEIRELIADMANYIDEFGQQDHAFRNEMQAVVSELGNTQNELAEIKDAHELVMSEKCAPDERHCVCVPVLRAGIENLKAELQRVYGLVDHHFAVANNFEHDLIELRDAVAWYFECTKADEGNFFNINLGHPHYLRALSEMEDTMEHAEQQLRKLGRGGGWNGIK